MRLAQSALRYRIEDAARAAWEFCEDAWFDWSRNVRTSRNFSLEQAGIAAAEAGDSHMYQPARPRHIRRALRDLPVRDLSGFRYIDLGSGKGRTLFVAAEFPFSSITGVEFSRVFHEEACENIRRFRGWRRRCGGPIVSLYGNARDFVFPESKLVLYLFNPFGAATMQQVLGNLARSLACRRHVFVVLLWPRCEEMVAALDGMRLIRERRQYKIFEAHAGGAERKRRQEEHTGDGGAVGESR
jgi:SAM-dependent methyltransferase